MRLAAAEPGKTAPPSRPGERTQLPGARKRSPAEGWNRIRAHDGDVGEVKWRCMLVPEERPRWSRHPGPNRSLGTDCSHLPTARREALSHRLHGPEHPDLGHGHQQGASHHVRCYRLHPRHRCERRRKDRSICEKMGLGTAGVGPRVRSEALRLADHRRALHPLRGPQGPFPPGAGECSRRRTSYVAR